MTRASWRAVLAVVLLGLACDRTATGPGTSGEEGDGRPRIVATVGMIADVVSEVVGDRAVVVPLMPSGVDPHLFKPTRSDAVKISQADVIFYNGMMLEAKMTESFARAARTGKPVHAVTELLDPSYRITGEGNEDPHVWMDPRAWRAAVDLVRDRMTEFDPAAVSVYAENARAYRARLETLDAYAREVLATVPADQRVLVTAHDAFAYFGRRYGYEVVGVQGLTTESEAGIRDIERLVDLLVARRVRAVFVESTVSDRNVRALIEGARRLGHEVALGGELFSDAMGRPGTYEGTYIGMIDHNVTTIARALGGRAPAGGMSGELASGGSR